MAGRDMSGIDREVKAELRPGTRTCQCSDCGVFFGSPAPFDKHLIRTAKYGRCMTPKQMEAIGMVQNSRGVWLTGVSTGKGVGRKRKAVVEQDPEDEGSVTGWEDIQDLRAAR